MRAKFSSEILSSPDNAEMASIMRSCVHCGFCNATCPTYGLRGDELDGPRGRIYLIKSMLEDAAVTEKTQSHLDRCLTCRACETTCPSGVKYGRLVELARPLVDERVGRTLLERLERRLIRLIIPNTRRFGLLMAIARLLKPIFPAALREFVPPVIPSAKAILNSSHERKMVLLDGCVQPVTGPEINAAAYAVFDRLGVELLTLPNAGCCGAVSYHLGEVAEAKRYARQNVDTWHTALERGAEAVVSTSTGCTAMLKDYGELLAGDPAYAKRAQEVAAAVRDPSEVLDAGELGRAYQVKSEQHIAFHAPCSMQHSLHVSDNAEACLRAVGFELTSVPDGHLCCGSAGSYSLLQPRLSSQLLDQKLTALQSDGPTVIASANIGCLMHLRRRAEPRVQHWLELISAYEVADAD
jgi:glycolate oxidase iron-sulfur subunit